MSAYSIDEIRSIRCEVSKKYLLGAGVELGAGVTPQGLPRNVSCKYFDKYSRDFVVHFFGNGQELPYELYDLEKIDDVFPVGADFLIAHNVLEHCENPIATLIEWFGYIKDGGVMVIGLPLPKYCLNDAKRVPTPFPHILEDFLFERTQDDFESREHIYSFRLGWREDKADLTKDEYLDFVQAEGMRKGHDIHWHIGSYDVFLKVILAAGYFSQREIQILATTHDPEALFVFRINKADSEQLDDVIKDDMAYARSLLKTALDKIGRTNYEQETVTVSHRLSANQQSQIAMLNQQLDAMLSSRSWQFTAPLREMMGIIRRMKNTLGMR